MNKCIGILGGMGPLATADLLKKIVELTDARIDQEHIHIYIDCNTEVPPRTAAILEGGESPLPQLIRSAVKLEGMGADYLGIACNTAHYYYQDLLGYVRIPIVNMLDETTKAAKRAGIHKVGLLATDGTVKSGVYDRAFAGESIAVVHPTAEAQAQLTRIIDGVKAGEFPLTKAEVEALCGEYLSRGAETLILGCTELPVACAHYQPDCPMIDPTTVLAKKLITLGGKRVKGE